jgi:chromosome partitioning protein
MLTTIVNQKGGVGKTTTAVNLSDGLVRRGRSILLIDLDSQANASVALGFRNLDTHPGVSEMLFDQSPAREVIQSTGRENLDIIIGDKKLADADVLLSDEIGRESILKKRLQFITDRYDHIIIDTPPSMGLLPINALVATDNYLIPVSPTNFSLQGIERIWDSVQKVQDGMQINIPLFGILLTMCDYRSMATKKAIAKVRKDFNGHVFNTEIHINTRLNEAQGKGQTIYEYDRFSTGSKYYEDFTVEFIKNI